MVTKGIYLFWDKKYEQVIYAGRFTGKKRIKAHFYHSRKDEQQVNRYVQSHPERIDSVIFCEFDEISDDDLNQLEKEIIKLFRLNRYKHPNSHVFNFNDGGEGMSGFTHTEKTKKKMSEAKLGENHPRFNKTLSEEYKQKISKSMSGENNPRAKYTLWDITKCCYIKGNIFQNGNDGKSPRRCFQTKYNGKKLPINMNLDFYTPELINDLINEFLEVN